MRHILFALAMLAPMLPLAAIAAPPGPTYSINDSLTLTANPTSVAADGAEVISLLAVLNDAQNNPLAGQQVSLSISGAGNRFGVATGTTDNLGRFSTTLKSSQAGSKIVTATAGNLAAYSQVTFTAGAPAVRQSLLTVAPGFSQVADNQTPFVITATLRDAYGNPVGGYTLTPTSDSPGATFTPASGPTGPDGRFVATLTSTRSARQKITIPVGTDSLSGLATFTGGNPNSAATLFTIIPASTLQADGNDAFGASLLLQDNFGNPVNGYPVTFGSDHLAVTLMPNQGVTNSKGIFSAAIKSKFVGTTNIVYTAGPLTGGNSITFRVGEPKNATSTITTSPTTTVADGSSLCTVTATVRDASGNPVPNQALDITVSGKNNVVSLSQCTSDGNGLCSFTITSTRAESKNVYATAGLFQAKGVALFVAGPPIASASGITSDTNATLVADGAAAFLLNVRFADAQGNPVISAPVVMSSPVPTDIFKPVVGKTNALGVFSTQYSAKAVGARTVTATNPILAESANFSFGLGPMSLATSTFVASPHLGLVADGATTTLLTAQLRDAQGRTLGNVGVTLSASGYSNNFSNAAPTTDANGVVTATLSSTRAETKKVTLSFRNTAIATSVTFVAGSPNGQVSTLVSNTTKPIVSTTTGAKLLVTVMDAFGNTCANVPVTFSSTGSVNTFAIAGGNTTAYGSLSTTLISTQAEVKTVTAHVGALEVTAPVAFAAAAPSAATSNITASPNSGIVANGTASSTLSVSLLDIYNNPVVGQSVYLYINDRNVTTAKKSGLTDASGQFTTTMVSTTPGSKVVSLQAGAASKTTTVSFVAPPIARLQLPPPKVMPWELIDAPQNGGALALVARRPTPSAAPWVIHLSPSDAAAQWAVAHPYDLEMAVYTQPRANDCPVRVRHTLQAGAHKLLAGDLNGDGLTDLLVATQTGLESFWGEAAGGFEAASVIPYTPERDVALIDVDGDGLDDVAILSSEGDFARILRNSGHGAFEDPWFIPCSGPVKDPNKATISQCFGAW